MKLGLLVVLAVAVLVPSLSEGQNVPSCQLKDPNQTPVEAGNMRNKREADDSSEESDLAEIKRSLEEAGKRMDRDLSALKPKNKRFIHHIVHAIGRLFG
uniref:Antibacterial toxin n=1 Tax=Pogonoperca punctata TaxID=160738 RepID=A0ZT21_POGPU|nr:antibacterial toxin [Pogonoperca punctata]